MLEECKEAALPKLIREPEVFLVGMTDFFQCQDYAESELGTDEDGVERYLELIGAEGWETDADSSLSYLTEMAGRVCYNSFIKRRPGGNKAYIDNIVKAGHGSVLEHASFNFVLKGISRSLSLELVRHRIGVAVSQESQRYVDASDTAFVVPNALLDEYEAANLLVDLYSSQDPDASKRITAQLVERWGSLEAATKAAEAFGVWHAAINAAKGAYGILTEYLSTKFASIENATERRKAARQAARSVLPNAAETTIFWSVNIRALRHIIEMRCSRHAEVEIRKLFNKVFDVVSKVSPVFFADYRKIELPDGTHEITTDNRKV